MFRDRLDFSAEIVEKTIINYLKDFSEVKIVDAMRYSLQGGKKLRAFFVLESSFLFDIDPDLAKWPASGIEAMHTYSLVHDDLPDMDNDDLRRGRPTVHKKWDVATAILVGDALQALSFELTLNSVVPNSNKLAYNLGKAAGAKGLVLGQALDISAEKSAAALSLNDIIKLQQGKTGALILWAVTAGAYMASEDVRPLENYAKAVGLAFQIADDLLDATGDQIKAGKKLMKDASANKATFVSLLGIDGAQKKARDLIDEACDSISIYGQRSQVLKQAAEFVISRDY
ncbi:polyprenyl synthetase family protein [Paracoccaceae bacterium]|nr:polyprenyl synthetase family protein [Paracoccaceae bacterium]